MSIKKLLMVVVAVASLGMTNAGMAQQKDIVTTAVEAGSFKTLAAALTAGDLVGALQGKGPFTVFAPTDEAFAKIPADTLKMLLKPENKDKLVAILTYHVVSGKVDAAHVVDLSGATTLNGQRVDIAVNDGTVNIDKASVVKADIQCSNGIIHVIDTVMMPASDNIVATADKAGTFKTLLAAAKAAGLVEALTGEGPLTVFAPNDKAFAALPAGTVESLLKPENKDQLVAILKYHVVAGRVYSNDVLDSSEIETLNGSAITPAMVDGNATISGAGLVATDVDASNGVIHIIDAVMMPPKASETQSVTYMKHVCPSTGTVTYSVAPSSCNK